jgi:hypothetical protein
VSSLPSGHTAGRGASVTPPSMVLVPFASVSRSTDRSDARGLASPHGRLTEPSIRAASHALQTGQAGRHVASFSAGRLRGVSVLPPVLRLFIAAFIGLVPPGCPIGSRTPHPGQTAVAERLAIRARAWPRLSVALCCNGPSCCRLEKELCIVMCRCWRHRWGRPSASSELLARYAAASFRTPAGRYVSVGHHDGTAKLNRTADTGVNLQRSCIMTINVEWMWFVLAEYTRAT